MNISTFVQEVADLASQGWTISPTFPANIHGFRLYEVELEFDGTPPEPKLSRAEILAKARAAKAEKAKASDNTAEE
jgi:hypothetical protein